MAVETVRGSWTRTRGSSNRRLNASFKEEIEAAQRAAEFSPEEIDAKSIELMLPAARQHVCAAFPDIHPEVLADIFSDVEVVKYYLYDDDAPPIKPR